MTDYVPCRCGCQPMVLTGCGCPECRPGSGISHTNQREIRQALSRERQERLRELRAKWRAEVPELFAGPSSRR